MRLTRTHALYWAARKGPEALRQYAQKVSIDACVNAHDPSWPQPLTTDMQNLVSVVKTHARHQRATDWIFERADWVLPGEGEQNEFGKWVPVEKRVAICRKWRRKILQGRNK